MTAAASRPARAGVWRIDPAHSTVHFSVRHLMISRVRGRFHDIDGTLQLGDRDLEGASVEVSIAAATIDTGIADRDRHLRSADFLDVERFPRITFRGGSLTGSLDRFELTGELSLHGVTRPVALEVRFEGRGVLPGGGARIGFSATTTLDRRDFGLTWNQALEAGGVLVGDEIAVQIELQAAQVDA